MLQQMIQRTNIFCLVIHGQVPVSGENIEVNISRGPGQNRLLAVEHPQEKNSAILIHFAPPPRENQRSEVFCVQRGGGSIQWGEECQLFIEEVYRQRTVQARVSQRPSRTRLEILRVLDECYPGELSITALKARLTNYTNIYVTLTRLLAARRIEKTARGLYRAMRR
jgi:hypothetical protein